MAIFRENKGNETGRIMKNLAVITARSGSKGLKDKNIRDLCGKPLMAYSIEAAIASKCFSDVMVSTDSIEYGNIAKEYGASVPFYRSDNTSNDTANSWDAIKEVLDSYNRINMMFDTVCLLQPTSPLRKFEHIIEAYRSYVEKNADAITSVCKVEHSPLWIMTLRDDASLQEFRKSNINNVPRQRLENYYRLNGAIYIRKIEYCENQIFLREDKEYAYVMPRKYSVDIDTIDDFDYAEFLLKKELNI